MRPALLCLVISSIVSQTSFAASEEHSASGAAVIREMNLARQNPGLYASYVEELRAGFNGNFYVLPGGTRVRTKEGTRALDETIRFLRHVQPLPPLALSPGISRAAADHCADQSNGRMGHDGSDRSTPGTRISRYGEWGGGWAENIAYAKTNARDIVLALIIDDGQPARKHRKNIFNPKFNVAGAAIGPHARLRAVCSIDFAGSYAEQGQGTSAALVARNF
jgi:uncharacterized protein YkwD